VVIVALIIGSLALVAATVSVVLIAREQKRSHNRNAAYVETMRTVVQEHRSAMEEYILKENGKCEERVNAVCSKVTEAFEKRISDLEGGVMPDYEKAKAAAQAVNDFSTGISGILGFDPMDAVRKSREREGDS
jgi:ribosomal protein S20